MKLNSEIHKTIQEKTNGYNWINNQKLRNLNVATLHISPLTNTNSFYRNINVQIIFDNNNIDSELYDYQFYNTTLRDGDITATTFMEAYISTKNRSSNGTIDHFPALEFRGRPTILVESSNLAYTITLSVPNSE